MTGLSETMAPGNFRSLALSDAIAFRAEFQGDCRRRTLRYWRGPVLGTSTAAPGARATIPARSSRAAGGARPTATRGARAAQPHVAVRASRPRRRCRRARATATTARSWRRTGAHAHALRHHVGDAPGPARGGARGSAPRAAPARRLQPARQRARRANGAPVGSDAEVLARAIAFFRAGRLGYTLEPLLLGPTRWTSSCSTTKEGFCEHFSSAFAFLMRAAGMPARVVTGYQGGELNPVDSIAHRAPGRRPRLGRGAPRGSTAGCASTRPRRRCRAARPAWRAPCRRPRRCRFYAPGTGMAARAALPWEAAAHKWNVWVLGYNPERQRELMSRIGMRDADWRALTAALFAFLGAITLVLLAWSPRRASRPGPGAARLAPLLPQARRARRRALAARGPARLPPRAPRARCRPRGTRSCASPRSTSRCATARASADARRAAAQAGAEFRPMRSACCFAVLASPGLAHASYAGAGGAGLHATISPRATASRKGELKRVFAKAQRRPGPRGHRAAGRARAPGRSTARSSSPSGASHEGVEFWKKYRRTLERAERSTACRRNTSSPSSAWRPSTAATPATGAWWTR